MASFVVAARMGTARGVIALRRERGQIVCERCVVADRMLSRMRGLLGKSKLPAGDGLLIRRAPSIHTFFMRFPIDAVFLSGEGEVLKVAERVKPWRVRGARRARDVLELGAGEASRRRIVVGDRLEALEISSRP